LPGLRGVLPDGVGSPADLARLLDGVDYLADDGVATAAYLALALPRPLLLEGEAGTGKTSLAQALADVLGAQLLRLQCYEGIDAAQALFDWDFPRQLLHLRAARRRATRTPRGWSRRSTAAGSCSRRPLLAALETTPSVLLVDEVDRADDEFEAFLLGGALGLHGDGARAGHGAGRGAAGRRRHVEPHPRGARRAQAPLPLPLVEHPSFERRGSRSCAGGCRRRPRGSPSRSPAPCRCCAGRTS
jgi:hypothetical protein